MSLTTTTKFINSTSKTAKRSFMPAIQKQEFIPRTNIEPYRIKMIEPINILTRNEREKNLQSANYNLFKLPADTVTIDLITDSGTSAMSQEQWSKLLLGDESYAHAKSWYNFKNAVQGLTNMKHIFPVHQGRAGEKLLFGAILNKNEQQYVPGNTHFDTTRANIEYNGAQAVDMVIPDGINPYSNHPFKGNIDIGRLDDFVRGIIQNNAGRDITEFIPLIVLTITNNSGGGQPVSMENMIELREKIGDKYGIPLFLDCARFAENAWFIQQRESSQKHKTCKEIALEFFKLFDGACMSMKKDALANIGGFLAFNQDYLKNSVQNMGILTEGFPTYGGLAGRDLEALAQGLDEVLDENYLNYRMLSTQYLFNKLKDKNIPMLQPCGGHAIYLDSLKFFDHIAPEDLPGQSLSCALYLEGGIRSVEIGTVMFGKTDINSGRQICQKNGMDLVRLAIPRRVYTQSHMDYVIETVEHVYNNKENYSGYKIIQEPPFLRHFTCDFDQVSGDELYL